MRSIFSLILFCTCTTAIAQKTISKSALQDKIRGGWAGQTIGVSLGAPYEFRFSGSYIQDYQPLTWRKGYVKELMLREPGIYDDLYMDLTFVEVFEKYGLDAHIDSFAHAFAHADYQLWHANQAARYNILNGISAPASGHWKNSPHADDIDFQIEADFAGLMSPGMPAAAASISDRIGHIMNYGDGWYGGVYVSAMYTQAFFSNNVDQIVSEALKAIPEKTKFRQCIADVIRWHQQYPTNWHKTWLEIQEKWSSDMACPDGIYSTFNIDATINAAYVVLGLLYGGGDYGKSLEITTRAGQDADCNPSTVGGILGTMLGYEKIPAYWKEGLEGAEDINFKYTSTSLNKVYEIGMKHALQNVVKNGGKVDGSSVTIPSQKIGPVKFEQGFEGLNVVHEMKLDFTNKTSLEFSFMGKAFVIKGYANKQKADAPNGTIRMKITIDDHAPEVILLPTDFQSRKHDVYWNYGLDEKMHTVKLERIDQDPTYRVDIPSCFYYTSK